jgi:hypothetical protein
MYRLIFLLFFSFPLCGMDLEWHPSPDGVIHMSRREGKKIREGLQAENVHIKRFSSRADNNPKEIKFEFWGELKDNEAKIPLTEPEAELFFNSLIRKYSLVKLTKFQLLARLNANQNSNAFPVNIRIIAENVMN